MAEWFRWYEEAKRRGTPPVWCGRFGSRCSSVVSHWIGLDPHRHSRQVLNTPCWRRRVHRSRVQWACSLLRVLKVTARSSEVPHRAQNRTPSAREGRNVLRLTPLVRLPGVGGGPAGKEIVSCTGEFKLLKRPLHAYKELFFFAVNNLRSGKKRPSQVLILNA